MIEDFWKTRKLGFKPLKLVPLKVKGFGIQGQQLFPKRKDSDFDGIPDSRDCRPYNPLKQHDISPEEAVEKAYGEITGEPEEVEEVEPIEPKSFLSERRKEVKEFKRKRKAYKKGRFEELPYFVFAKNKYTNEWQEFGEFQNYNDAKKMVKEIKNTNDFSTYNITRDPDFANRENAKIKPKESEYLKKSQFGKHIKEGLTTFHKLPKGKAVLRIRGFQGNRRLTPEEKLSPNFQQTSVFGKYVCPYRPISVQQAIPKLPLISSPYIDRIRRGESYQTPRTPLFYPQFVGRGQFEPTRPQSTIVQIKPPFLRLARRVPPQEVQYEEE